MIKSRCCLRHRDSCFRLHLPAAHSLCATAKARHAARRSQLGAHQRCTVHRRCREAQEGVPRRCKRTHAQSSEGPRGWPQACPAAVSARTVICGPAPQRRAGGWQWRIAAGGVPQLVPAFTSCAISDGVLQRRGCASGFSSLGHDPQQRSWLPSLHAVCYLPSSSRAHWWPSHHAVAQHRAAHTRHQEACGCPNAVRVAVLPRLVMSLSLIHI